MFRRNFLTLAASCLPATLFVRPSVAAESTNKNPNNLPVIQFNEKGEVTNWDELKKHTAQFYSLEQYTRFLNEYSLPYWHIRSRTQNGHDVEWHNIKWIIAYTHAPVLCWGSSNNKIVTGEVAIEYNYYALVNEQTGDRPTLYKTQNSIIAGHCVAGRLNIVES